MSPDITAARSYLFEKRRGMVTPGAERAISHQEMEAALVILSDWITTNAIRQFRFADAMAHLAEDKPLTKAALDEMRKRRLLNRWDRVFYTDGPEGVFRW